MSSLIVPKPHFIYLASMYGKVLSVPKRIYKIGISGMTSPLDRLNYRGTDEPFPITDYFERITIIDALLCPSKDESKRIESYAIGYIKDFRGCKYFKDFYVHDKISGLTEMRMYNEEEVTWVGEFIEFCRSQYDAHQSCYSFDPDHATSVSRV